MSPTVSHPAAHPASRPRRPPWWLVLLLLVGIITHAAAEQQEDTEALIREGQQALADGKPAQSALIFERVVLEQPWRLGVWMDYALALQLSGDADSARIIYQQLLTRDPPEYLRKWLQRQVQADLRNGERWRTGGNLRLQFGHDSNINRATGADSLGLTYPFGLVELKLADSARARSASAFWLGADWEAGRAADDGGSWSIRAIFDARIVPEMNDQNALQPNLGITRQWRQDTRETLLNIAWQQLNYGGMALQNQLRVGLYRGQPWSAAHGECTLLYGAEWKIFRHPASAEIDGDYLGGAINLGCINGSSWNLLAHAGIDHPRNARPGYRQYQMDINLQHTHPLGKGHLLTGGGAAIIRDTRGYSELLENNSVRTLRRGNLNIEYTHPLTATTQGAIRLESYSQRSNIALFDNAGHAIWFTLRRTF